jgi:hypothetical protein
MGPMAAFQFLNVMSDEAIGELTTCGFDFTSVFVRVKPSIQARILGRVAAREFERLVREHAEVLEAKEDRFKRFIVSQCLDRFDLLRGLRFCEVADCNFCEFLQAKAEMPGFELFQCLEKLRSGLHEWGDSRLIETFGCCCQFVGLLAWALASFVVLKNERRVGSILTECPAVMLLAMHLTREKPTDPDSVFLEGLGLGL